MGDVKARMGGVELLSWAVMGGGPFAGGTLFSSLNTSVRLRFQETYARVLFINVLRLCSSGRDDAQSTVTMYEGGPFDGGFLPVLSVLTTESLLFCSTKKKGKRSR